MTEWLAARHYFEVWAVADLPPTKPFRVTCMGADYRPRLTLTGRQRCCWYHARNWAAINKRAVRLVEEAHRLGASNAEQVRKFVDAQVGQPGGLFGGRAEDHDALLTLFNAHRALLIGPSNNGFTNGQHRAQAMTDQRVKRTVVLRWTYPTDSEE